MASEKITNIVEELKTLTIIEVAELVKEIEEAFGVSAAAATVVAAAPAADGAAAAIVQQNLAKTNAVNDVTSIVFDLRGYDTMGEAFILCTAVAGSTVILYSAKNAKKEEGQDE